MRPFEYHHGIDSVITVDHDFSVDELICFEDTLFEALRCTSLNDFVISDSTCRDRVTSFDERRSRLQEEYWLDFEIRGSFAIDCSVGVKAVAFDLLDPGFIWINDAGRQASVEVISSIIAPLCFALRRNYALVGPSRRYYPGGWIIELICEGLSVTEIIDRFDALGEPEPLGSVEFTRFLNSHGSERSALADKYFLVTMDSYP